MFLFRGEQTDKYLHGITQNAKNYTKASNIQTQSLILHLIQMGDT
jgi:hypothetical protein